MDSVVRWTLAPSPACEAMMCCTSAGSPQRAASSRPVKGWRSSLPSRVWTKVPSARRVYSSNLPTSRRIPPEINTSMSTGRRSPYRAISTLADSIAICATARVCSTKFTGHGAMSSVKGMASSSASVQPPSSIASSQV